MKILIPTDVFPPRCGGVGWSSFFLAKALQERGHEVDVVVPVFGAERTVVDEYEGLRVTRLGFPHKSGIPLYRTYVRTELFWKQGSRMIEKIVRAGGYDVVNAQHLSTVPASILACRRAGVPVVSTLRDWWPVCYLGPGIHGKHACVHDGECVACYWNEQEFLTKLLAPLVFAYTRRNVALRQEILKQSNALICIGMYQKKVLSKFISKPMHYVPNFIETRKNAGVKKHEFSKPTIVYAAKLDYQKGPHLLVEAAGLMKNRDKAAFVFMGDGPLKKPLERRAKALGVDAVFLGDVPRDKMLGMMKGSAGVAVPMLLPESFGRTALEAGSVGAPVVTLACGEMPGVIKGGCNGLLAKPDAAGLAEKLDLLLEDEALRRRVGRNLKRTVETQFNKYKVVKATERVYEQVVFVGK